MCFFLWGVYIIVIDRVRSDLSKELRDHFLISQVEKKLCYWAIYDGGYFEVWIANHGLPAITGQYSVLEQ